MKRLYLVIDTARWGYSHSIVRAESETEALRLAIGPAAAEMNAGCRGIEIQELNVRGESQVLWCHDESPDTPVEYD